VRISAGIVVGILALAVAFGFPYSVISEYGGFGGSVVLIAFIAGPIAALAAWLVTGRPLPAAVAGVLLSLVAAVTGGWLGQVVKDRNERNIATACSPAERADLQALGTVPTDGRYGFGSADGSCSALLGERSIDRAELALSAQHWTLVRGGVYTRDGRTLLVEVTDEGEKGQNITFRFPG
jgi:hypothetical protein